MAENFFGFSFKLILHAQIETIDAVRDFDQNLMFS